MSRIDEMLDEQGTRRRENNAFARGGKRVYASGEMAECIRKFEWERTPLGAMEGWSDALVGAVNLILETQFPTVLLWGPELVVMYNDGYMPLMAEKHPTCLGQPGKRVWPEAWHIFGAKLEATFERGERFYLEEQLIPVVRNGVLTDVYWTYGYSPVRDAAGTVCGVMAISPDVTAKLVAERERDAIAANLQHVLESTTDGLATLDRDWRYTYMNEQGARMVGLRPQDFVGKVVWDLFPQEMETEFGREYRLAVQTGKPRHFDALLPGPSTVWLECHCYPTEQGLSVYFRDVTEQKKTEKELREREERFRVLSESLPAIIWMSNTDGENTYCNRRYPDYVGMDAAATMGFGWKQFIHPDDIVRTEAAWKRAFDTSETYVDEFRLRRKDGMYRHFLSRAVPIRNEAGQVEQWIGSATDIHDQKLAEDALRKSEKLATAGRLAASIAHEINNPLEGVVNSLFLALHDETLTEATRGYLTMAEDELMRVSHITTQTLRFHRQSKSPKKVDVCEISDSVMGLFKGRLASKHIQVEMECTRGAYVMCLADEIRQVVANLVSNAMDATPEGKIRLRVRETRSWTKGEWVEGAKIVVADTGYGIARSVADHVFEPFVTTKEATGIGLGLWVSDGIVRRHGGWIRVRSRQAGPSTGTVFEVFLPAEASEG